jgi:hypothetical protein
MMTKNVKTNSDTLSHPELGSVGDLVVVLEVGDVVKVSTGLGPTLVDDIVVVATVVSSTGIGVGAGVIVSPGGSVGSKVTTTGGAVLGFGVVGVVIGVSPK